MRIKHQTSKVLEIEMCKRMKEVQAGDSVLLLLEKGVDVKRGDILVKHSWADIGVSNCLENSQV